MLKKLISYFTKGNASVPSFETGEELIPSNITCYSDTQDLRRWILMYEGVQLVFLNYNDALPQSKSLLAFEPYGDLIWELSPYTKQESDRIISVYIKNGELIARSYSCFNLTIDCKTGEVLESRYTK